MIKHLAEGLVPFEDCGFARSPELPLAGEPITVYCRMDANDAEPELTLWRKGAKGEQAIRGARVGDRRYAFELGAYDKPITLTYRITAGDESTSLYRCEVLSEQVITAAYAMRAAADGSLCLALADDLTLLLGQDATVTLTSAEEWRMEATDGRAVCPTIALPDGFSLCCGDCGYIWALKRLSEPLVETTAYRVLRNADGIVRKVTLEARMGAKHVLGTGERFDAVERMGRGGDGVVAERFTHQGDQTYLPMPFFMTEQGFGWYCESDAPASMFFGDRLVIARQTEGDMLARDHLLTGEPSEVLSRFIGLTGKPALPPEWCFGVWISGNGWNDDAEVDAQLSALKRFNYPASVMVLEQWSDERTFYLWSDRWQDPAAMVARVRSAGLHLVLWQIPVVKYEWDGESGAELESETREATKRGYVVNTGDGEPYRITENWFHHSLLPDFTNPEACEWWFDKRRHLLNMGVEGFKTDGGEFLFDKLARLHDGTSGLCARNLYPVQYARAYNSFMAGEGVDGVTFSRAGYLGAQTVPIHWAGDQKSEWSELRAQLNAGLSAGLSGVIFWSFDIGGFAGEIPDGELYLRATAMACFCPVMQWHSEPRGGQFSGGAGESYNNDRSPWNLAEKLNDERVLTVACDFARLRERLRAYLWREARACVENRRPMMAHLAIDYPYDARAWDTHDEYMLGRELLVAPITERGAAGRAVYLPSGRWRDYFTGEIFEGTRELWVDCPLERALVYQREAAL